MDPNPHRGMFIVCIAPATAMGNDQVELLTSVRGAKNAQYSVVDGDCNSTILSPNGEDGMESID